MTDLDLTKLREIAAAATPGPWGVYDANEGMSPPRPYWSVANNEFHNPTNLDALAIDISIDYGDKDDAAHIAAFDPPTVLALIAEVERLRDALASSEYMRDVQRKDRTAQAFERLRAENDRLRGEVERLRRVRADLTDIAVAVTAERDEARATLDAVRELAGHWDDRQPNPWPKRGQRRTIAACLETHASELRRILDGAGAGDSDE